jgi:hypothetical protein
LRQSSIKPKRHHQVLQKRRTLGAIATDNKPPSREQKPKKRSTHGAIQRPNNQPRELARSTKGIRDIIEIFWRKKTGRLQGSKRSLFAVAQPDPNQN